MMTETIPQPPGLPFLGNILDIQDEVPIRALENLADIYGPIYRLRLGGEERIFISSQELLDEICDESRFWKTPGPGLRSLQGKGASGLFTAPSEAEPDWQQAHRTLLPAFGPLAIREMFDEMYDMASQLVMKWARKGSEYKIPVTNDFTRVTLDTIGLCAMGYRFNSFYQDELHPFVVAMNNTLEARSNANKLLTLIHNMIFGPGEKIKADRALMRNIANELVRERREHPADKNDLLNAMLLGKDPKTRESMRDDLITANMVTFLISGHETTSGLLSFAFLELLKNPDTYHKAQQEVDRVIGKGKLTVDKLQDLEYLNAVLRETLRLHPTAPGFGRSVRPENKENPAVIGHGQYSFDRNTQIIALIGKAQRDPNIYGEDANEFRPERMLDEEFNKLPKGAWKPFGTGLRACIGRAFAWQEALLVSALILQNLDVRLDDTNYELRIKQTLTIKPIDFYMRATLREGRSATRLLDTLSAPSSGSEPAPSKKIQDTINVSQAEKRPLTILYGSNSGTCQSLAQNLASSAGQRGFRPTMTDLDAAVHNVPRSQSVVIVTSSYDGQPTDNARQYIAWLESLQDHKTFDGVDYAVFGCGHSDWTNTYQRIPTLVAKTMGNNGGRMITDRGEANAAKGDIFQDFEAWCEQKLWPAITTIYNVQVDPTQTSNDVNIEISTQGRASSLKQDVRPARVISAKVLTAPGEPEKRHLDIELPSEMPYECGDCLAVLPLNSDVSIQRVFEKYGLPWDAVIKIISGGPLTLPEGTPLPAYDLFKGYVELSLPATKQDIRTCIEHCTDQQTKSQLSSFLGEAFREAISIKRPLILHHNITYSVINTEAYSGHGRFQGVTGSYLRALKEGDTVQVSIWSTNKHFRLPSDVETMPIIMLCAGTGLAPFRGFIQERATLRRLGNRELSRAFLFVGCRSPTADRLYGDEIDTWVANGIVDVRYSFSREPQASSGCRYVQDRMLHDREDIIRLWEQGAKVFVCGGPELMQSVGKAARDILTAEAEKKGRRVRKDEVEEWLKERRNERFVTDVFR